MSTTEQRRRQIANEVLDHVEGDEVTLTAVRVVVAQHLGERFAWAVRSGLGVGVITQLESRVLRHALAAYAAKHAGKLVDSANPAPQGATQEGADG